MFFSFTIKTAISLVLTDITPVFLLELVVLSSSGSGELSTMLPTVPCIV